MEIRPRKLSFWPTYWLVFGMMSLFMLSLLPMIYVTVGRLPAGFVDQFLGKFLQCLLAFVPLAAWVTWLLLWSRKRDRRWHWLVHQTCVEIYRDATLLATVPWEEVSRVTFVKGRIGLAMRGQWIQWTPYSLPGMTRGEYKMVVSYYKNEPAKN